VKREKNFAVPIVLALMLIMSLASSVEAATPEDIETAIEAGITWLAAQQYPDGSWGTTDKVGKTGLAVLKFETHALRSDPPQDPLDPAYEYYTEVRDGLNFIFSRAYLRSPIEINVDPDYDPDGDNTGVYFLDSYSVYETGIAAMAIAASTHPEAVVNVPTSVVHLQTFEDVLQDVVDWLAHAQNNPATGIQRGGWRYVENYGSSDNSVSGYAVLGLVYAESSEYGFALTIPQFVKDELSLWIDVIQNDVDGDTYDGGSDYDTRRAPYFDYWVNVLKTGNLLQEMAFVGDPSGTTRVQDAIDYLVRHWGDADYIGWRGYPTAGYYACYQAMYTIMKGLEAYGIENIDGIDWYNDFADVLLAEQNLPGDGSWPAAPLFGDPSGGVWSWDSSDRILSTTWALLVLEMAAPVIIPPATIESCSDSGVPQDVFAPGDNVYATGSDFLPGEEVMIRVLPNGQDYTLDNTISSTPAMANPDGVLGPPPNPIYLGVFPGGEYDIWVDRDGDGELDDNEPVDTFGLDYGFFVIPEYPLGTILGLAMCFAALAVFKSKSLRIHL